MSHTSWKWGSDKRMLIPVLTYKAYVCVECGHETRIQTNHYEDVKGSYEYLPCPICPPHFHRGVTTWRCKEEIPKTEITVLSEET